MATKSRKLDNPLVTEMGDDPTSNSIRDKNSARMEKMKGNTINQLPMSDMATKDIMDLGYGKK